MNPCCLNHMASYDVSSYVWRALTSGYLFLLVALQLTGQCLPGETSNASDDEKEHVDEEEEEEAGEEEMAAKEAEEVEVLVQVLVEVLEAEDEEGEVAAAAEEEDEVAEVGAEEAVAAAAEAAKEQQEDAAGGAGACVTLYGFEDDVRNTADGAGGHYFDSLHKQAHSLYDLGWERRAMAGLAARDQGAGRGEGGGVRLVRVMSIDTS